MTRLLQIKTLPNKQESSWIDRDTILLHAAFQILVDFVEIERPYEIALFPSCAWYNKPVPNIEKQHVSIEESEKQIAEWKLLFALYHWWKDGGLKQDSDATFPDRRAYDEDSEKLCELIRLREHLWT